MEFSLKTKTYVPAIFRFTILRKYKKKIHTEYTIKKLTK